MIFDDYFDFIAMDITGNCNLRCPFCLNDFSKITGNRVMDEDTFNRCMTLLPLVRDGQFYLSCLFEPTLHPMFTRFLHLIPEQYRKKCFFTTNLAKKLSDEDIMHIAGSGIHHIIISLDSFVPDVYEKLRVGSKFDLFMNNLDRVVSRFKDNEYAPKIIYNAVIMKWNVDTIEEIVNRCNQEYHAFEVHLRPVWTLNHNSGFVSNQLISTEDYNSIRDSIEKKSLKCQLERRFGEHELTDHDLVPLPYMVPPTSIRIDAAGNMELLERGITINIRDISDPYNFWVHTLPILKFDLERANEIQNTLERNRHATEALHDHYRNKINEMYSKYQDEINMVRERYFHGETWSKFTAILKALGTKRRLQPAGRLVARAITLIHDSVNKR